jgi:hypothetical protein
MMALLGVLVLLTNLNKPRVQALHGADILGLVACGICFGVAVIGLSGRLQVRNDP